MITLHSYAGSKQPLYAIIKMLIFVILTNARHVTESIKVSKLVVAVRHMRDQLSRQWL
jgi:hypothetical protein